MFTLTRNERIALIVLVFLLIAGSVISWLDTRNPRMIEEFRVVPGPVPAALESLSQSRDDAGASAPESVLATRQPDQLRSRVNVNLASAEELQRLPKIGPRIAQRIIEYRSRNGPFQSLEHLARVEGIGPKTLVALDSLVVVQTDRLGAR